MVAPAMGALVFARTTVGIRVCDGGHIGHLEELLKSSQGLSLYFDQVVEFFIILSGYGIDKFHGGFENKIICVIGEWGSGFNIVCDTKTGNLCGDLAHGGFGEFFDNERTESGKGLFAFGLGFPFVDGRAKVPVQLMAALKRARCCCGLADMPTFLSCCSILSSHSNLVAGFSFGFQALSIMLMSSCMSMLVKVAPFEWRCVSILIGVQ